MTTGFQFLKIWRLDRLEKIGDSVQNQYLEMMFVKDILKVTTTGEITQQEYNCMMNEPSSHPTDSLAAARFHGDSFSCFSTAPWNNYRHFP